VSASFAKTDGRSPDAYGSRVLEWLALPLLATAFVTMARWTWGTWPDVLVDFGRELYVPWRLSSGDALYRDIAWFNGPLSPWLNALLFELFGVSLRTIVVANLAIFAALSTIVYALLRAVADRLAALAGGLVLITLFGFGQLVGMGSYNFICPYSHDLTHGLFLAFGALLSLQRWDGRRSLLWVGLSGALLGACFLTKAEVFLAALLGAGASLGLTLWSEPGARERRGAVLGVLLGCGAAPVAAAFASLATYLPWDQAVLGTLGSWPSVLWGGAEDLTFYRRGMGLDAPLLRLGETLWWAIRWVAVLGPAALGSWLLARGARAAPFVAAAMLALTGWGLASLDLGAHWLGVSRALPVLVGGCAAWTAWRLAASPAWRRTGRQRLVLCVFSLVCLFKILLNARVHHYGFVLAMPATLVVVVAVTGWLPAWLEDRGRAGIVLRVTALACVAIGVAGHLRLVGLNLSNKTVEVGEGADAFLADARGRFVNQSLEGLAAWARSGSTLAVLPEGVMVNWLTRRVNPTPYINFMPPELLLYGEGRIVEAFGAAPPDFVVLVHKDTGEYGYPLFGRDYGEALFDWIREHYVPVRRYGQPPLQPGTAFGVQLLRRR